MTDDELAEQVAEDARVALSLLVADQAAWKPRRRRDHRDKYPTSLYLTFADLPPGWPER